MASAAVSSSPVRELPKAGRWPTGLVRSWFQDRPFLFALLVWALCCLAFAAYLYRFSVPFPNFDEWDLTPAATGEAHLNWKWWWLPANQHRAPLIRLQVVLLGWATAWDFRLAHYVNVAWLALGSLVLLGAVRAVRGRSSPADAFLPLLILTPGQFETVLIYAYGYAMALAWLSVAVSAATTGWPLRSVPRLVLYFLLLLGITGAGGPAGNFWAIGLCAVVLRGWLERQSRPWLTVGVAGSVIVVAVSVAMLIAIPHVPQHEGLQSDSLRTLLSASARLLVCWMGYPLLAETWPWPGVALAIPIAYCLGRIVIDGWRGRRGGAAWQRLAPSLDLAINFLAAAGVAVMIGYGRGRCPVVWDSRYTTLLAPVGVLLYLLLVRLRAPQIFAVGLAFVAAVCVGWNWSWALSYTRYWECPIVELKAALRKGDVPLSTLADRYAKAVGCEPSGRFLGHLVKLHAAGQSVFHGTRRAGPTHDRPPSLAWEAESGRQPPADLEVVSDIWASGGQALQVAPTADGSASVSYRIAIPRTGSYLLWGRLAASTPGQVWRVQVDGGPALEKPLAAEPGYHAECLDRPLDLIAGQHTLTVTLSGPGTRLDMMELLPRPR